MLNNVEISHNTAEFLGGGLAIYESEVDLLNTTFSKNIDHANNSAIWSSNSTASLVNSIVWDNQPNQLEGAYTISYSNIPGDTEIFGDGEGNINTDHYLLIQEMEILPYLMVLRVLTQALLTLMVMEKKI